MGKLGLVNWEIILAVVLYCGSTESQIHVITQYIGLDHQLGNVLLSIKSRVILKVHGIPLLSMNILRWYQSMFQFRDTICLHNHVVCFVSIFKHNSLNSSSTSDDATRRNVVEGSDSVVLTRSDKAIIKWWGHVWVTDIKIQFYVLYYCHWSRDLHHGFACIRFMSEFINTRNACRGEL